MVPRAMGIQLVSIPSALLCGARRIRRPERALSCSVMLPVVRVFCHAVFLCTSFVVARFPASAAHAASSPPTLTLVPPLPVVATLAPQQQDAAGSATERQSDLVILHINDFHGQFRPLRGPRPRGGVLALAREVREQRRRAVERGATFWMTDGGDWFQGTPEGNTSKGRLVVDLQRELGLDFATLGNHEFDFGSDNVRALVARARHPVLAANVVRKDGIRPPWLRSHVVRTVRGVRIALIGLVTKDTRDRVRVRSSPLPPSSALPRLKALT